MKPATRRGPDTTGEEKILRAFLKNDAEFSSPLQENTFNVFHSFEVNLLPDGILQILFDDGRFFHVHIKKPVLFKEEDLKQSILAYNEIGPHAVAIF